MGTKEEARVSRSEIRCLAAEDSSSFSSKSRMVLNEPPSSGLPDTNTSANNTMLPPPLPPPPNSSVNNTTRTGNRSALPPHNRYKEKRSSMCGSVSPARTSGGNSNSNSRIVCRCTAGERSPPTPEKIEKKIPNSSSSCNNSKSAKDEMKENRSKAVEPHVGSAPTLTPAPAASHSQQPPVSFVGVEKLNNSSASASHMIAWPRIYTALSRKEKEDDFFAMKGSKLPQRPRKRAKNIDRTLQYCFPGMWLSDLAKSRYEVREKRSVKKQQRRRGLKGMESVDSDSE